LDFDGIINVLNYLGYPVFDRCGPTRDITDDARTVAAAMAGKYTESVMLPAIIGNVWADLIGPLRETT
tara:strand:+ start:634 stop:837 length:204 start_codon:yes stop_codon:yes gene_type:complete